MNRYVIKRAPSERELSEEVNKLINEDSRYIPTGNISAAMTPSGFFFFQALYLSDMLVEKKVKS